STNIVTEFVCKHPWCGDVCFVARIRPLKPRRLRWHSRLLQVDKDDSIPTPSLVMPRVLSWRFLCVILSCDDLLWRSYLVVCQERLTELETRFERRLFVVGFRINNNGR